MKSVAQCAYAVLDDLINGGEFSGVDVSDAIDEKLAHLASFDGLFGFDDESNPPTTNDLLRALKAAQS